MSVLPPPVPPVPQPAPPAGPATGLPTDVGEVGSSIDVADAGALAPTAGRLTVPWRWLLAVGWSIVMSAMGAIAQSAFLADTGPFWLDLKPLPFALPVLALLALVGNWRTTLWVSLAAAVGTGAVAVGDLVAGHRGVALAEAVCAAGGLLLTLAGALSRARSAR